MRSLKWGITFSVLREPEHFVNDLIVVVLAIRFVYTTIARNGRVTR